MLKKLVFLLPVCASVVSGCMSTPDLSEATGAEHSDIMIKDVVQRVKCELSEAFDKKVEQREFLWLASWTAHADLTLQVNDNAGIAPNGGYTNYLGKTTESAGKSVLQTAVSSFSLSASANLNGQAVRSESVSFTVALDELKLWRRQIDKMEAKLPPEKRTCYFDGGTGVTGNLGLKEWVDSAFFPVEAGQLQAGVHPSGGGGGKSGGAAGPSSGGPKAKALEVPSRDKISKQAAEWATELTKLQEQTKVSFDKIDTAIKNMATADADLGNKLKVLNDGKFNPVLAPYLKKAYGESQAFEKYLKGHKSYEDNCSAYKANLDSAARMLTHLQAELTKPGSDVPVPLEIAYNNLSEAMDGIHANDYPKQSATCASALTQAADQAAKNAGALPNQIDPPIDSVAHSLNFVVGYGAGISPSWSLLQWKGPGGSGNTPFFSASGTRTHTLNIALAPRSGGPAIGTDALRLINNQVIRSIGQ
jgi:hypothetical protein